MARPQTLNVGHPAPARHAAHPLKLLFALCGGPAGWLGQLLLGFASTSYFCRPGGVAPPWLSAAIIAANLTGVAVAMVGLAVGLMLVRRTRHEHHGQPGGMLDAGEGRTRFLATWGCLVSAVFIAATLANSLSLWLVPLCKA